MKQLILTFLINLILINFTIAQSISFSDCVSTLTPCASTFVIDKLADFGNKLDKLGNSPCISSEENETNSLWIQFNINKSGSFAFDLIPLKSNDDIDFIVYKKKSTCEDLSSLRCMASGQNLGTIYNNSNTCANKTGLSPSSKDENEPSGCFGLADNYLSSFEAQRGDNYIVFINNYKSDNGVEFKFTGSAEFEIKNYPKYECSLNYANEQWSYKLNHKTTQGLGGCTINWLIIDEQGEQVFSGDHINNIYFSITGKKTVIRSIHSSAGCDYVDTTSIQVSSLTTTKNSKDIQISNVYPNPSKNTIYLEVSNPKLKSLKYHIVTVEGKEVLPFKNIDLIQYQVLAIDVTNLTPGNYFINIIDAKNNKIISSKRFITER